MEKVGGPSSFVLNFFPHLKITRATSKRRDEQTHAMAAEDVKNKKRKGM